MWIALALGLTGCFLKPQPLWVSNPEAIGSFEAVAGLGCAKNESERQCLERGRLAAQEQLAERIRQVLRSITVEFISENGLGDAQTADRLLEGVLQEGAERMLSRAQMSAAHPRGQRLELLLSVPDRSARSIAKETVIRALRSDDLLYEQAEMIRAFEGLDSLIERY